MPPARKKKSEPTYARYIHKVMKQVHPDLGISNAAILATNGITETVIARLIARSSGIAKAGKKSTLASKHVQGATKMIMPFDLSKHAISEGTKAVTKFTA